MLKVHLTLISKLCYLEHKKQSAVYRLCLKYAKRSVYCNLRFTGSLQCLEKNGQYINRREYMQLKAELWSSWYFLSLVVCLQTFCQPIRQHLHCQKGVGLRYLSVYIQQFALSVLVRVVFSSWQAIVYCLVVFLV